MLGYALIHNQMASLFDPHHGPQLDAEVLQESAHNMGAWGSSLAELVRCAQLVDAYDPFGHCPVCAYTRRHELDDGKRTCFQTWAHLLQTGAAFVCDLRCMQ